MEPGRPPSDSFKNPAEDLELAKRLKTRAEPAERVALDREGVAWPNADRKRACVTHPGRRRTPAFVAVLVVVFAVALLVVLGVI